MKIYLSGPMRGYAQYNYPAFHHYAKTIRSKGHVVISPAEMDLEIDKTDIHSVTADTPPPYSFSHYMKRDLPAICDCEAIATMPGWEKSQGATLEVYVARKLGKLILNAETLEPHSTEVTIEDPKTGGKKGQKLERFDLIPVHPLEELARVYGKGAQKYDDDNWRKGYSWRLSFGAMMRHAWKFWRGESIDSETGCHHLAMVAWHCFTLMWFEKNKPEKDDRADKIKNENRSELWPRES